MTENTRTWHQDSTFPPHTDHDWRTSVDQLLRGADFNKALVSKTLDGIEIQPLYQQMPDAPFCGRGDSTWNIHQTYRSGSLSDTNKNILSDLSDGLTSIELALPMTNSSADSTLPCYTVSDLEHLLTDVRPEMIELSLAPDSDNRLTGTLLLAWFYQQKIAPVDVRCALNIDPLGTQANNGTCAKPALNELTQFAIYCGNHFPNASSVCVDSSVYHNAGCSEAQELAFLLATSVEYLRALQTLDTDLAFDQMRFRIALDNDYFLNVAKLRAARELIRQIKQNCGATDSTITIDAVSGTRTITTLDSSVNILRNTTQASAAMTGGANGFNCTPFDQLTGSTEKAQRLARNTQHILIEESGLLNINDPARGSGYVESLTSDLCQSAWQLFQEIETSGGMHKSLEQGIIATQVETSCQARLNALGTGKSPMIGVTDYPDLSEPPECSEAVEQASTTQKEKRATTTKDDAKSDSTSVPALVGALSEGGSTLDFKSYARSTVTSEPLTQFRDSQVFEQLRHRSQTYKNNNSVPPTVTLITLGEKKDYAARVAFCKNFFAVAGIETNAIDLKATKNSSDLKSTDLVVLCSGDKQYLQEAAAICNFNQTANLWIAGNNKEVLSEMEAANISECVHLRSDKLNLLNKALSILGVPQ